MGETLHSVGIDVGTSTTQLILSRLTVENRANAYAVPDFTIGDREILYRSPIHFTPPRSATELDAAGIRQIVAEEYRLAGIQPQRVSTGAIIITGETAWKENARAVLDSLKEFAGEFVVATAGPDLRVSWPPKAQVRSDFLHRPAKRFSTWTSAAEPAIWPWWNPGMSPRPGA